MRKSAPVSNLWMEGYSRMFRHFGPRHWWPADSPFEVIVGAVLTQNTAWSNVEKAIENIKAAGALTVGGILNASPETLASWIRPSGYFNIKARRLQAVARFIHETYGGDLKAMRQVPLPELRSQLLRVHGVGEETADSILLYALGKPIFVVDAYTRRILSRHELIHPQRRYDEIQRLFMKNLPRDASLFNEYHALIVETGKVFCRRMPNCKDCPLLGWAGFRPQGNEDLDPS